MTAQPADKAGQAATGAEALGEALLANIPPAVLPPLFAPSAGAFAAAAAIGMGFANQMTGAYLGFLRGAMEQSRLMAEALGVADTDVRAVAKEATAVMTAVATAPLGPGATILPMKRQAPVVVIAEPAEEAAEEAVVAKTVAEPTPAKAVKPRAKAGKAAAAKAPKASVPEVAASRAAAKAKVDASDLKQIAGIGPKLESMLKARGIASLGAIAALSETEANELDKALGLDGRIARDGWVKAAAALL